MLVLGADDRLLYLDLQSENWKSPKAKLKILLYVKQKTSFSFIGGFIYYFKNVKNSLRLTWEMASSVSLFLYVQTQ